MSMWKSGGRRRSGPCREWEKGARSEDWKSKRNYRFTAHLKSVKLLSRLMSLRGREKLNCISGEKALLSLAMDAPEPKVLKPCGKVGIAGEFISLQTADGPFLTLC